MLLGRKAVTNLDSILKSKDKLKALLISVKEESEKAGFKIRIQKSEIMASDLITSQQIDGEKVEGVADFLLLGLQNHCEW